MQLCGAWDRYNPRLLGQQPGKCDLSGCGLLPFPDAGEQINQRLIRLASLRREARQGAAEVGAFELGVLVHLSREEALAQGAVRDEADAEFLKGRYHFLLRSPRPQRIFALQRGDRLDCVCATDGLHSCFGKAEVLNLAFLNQLLHRASYVFDGHVRVNPMLIEQVDCLNLEAFERALDGLLDVLGPAVQTRRSRPIIAAAQVEPELRGDYHTVTEGGESFADEFFVCERAVDLGGIEECDAAFHGCT